MKYMIKGKLIFDTKDDADQVYGSLELLVLKYKKINTASDREEFSYVQMQECRHDEKPPGKCSVVKEFNNK